MKLQHTPSDIWKRHNDGVQYKQSMDLPYIVERNNDFMNDIQWKGVNAPDLDKPVFNIIKPAINYYMAILISDAIAVDFGAAALFDPVEGPPPEMEELLAQGITPELISKILHSTTLRMFDLGNLMFNSRLFLRNCAVDGDACFHVFYSEHKKSVDIEVIDNLNVNFGDTSTPVVHTQPYIQINYRQPTSEVKKEAEENGIKNWASIKPDSDPNFQNSELSDSTSDFTTVVLEYWMEKGTLHCTKSTQDQWVQEDTNLGYHFYPIVWQSWERRKNSYHGVSPVSGRIPNQIFVNKSYALSMRHVINFAFPKVIYDEGALPDGWNNDVNAAVAVSGDPTKAIFAGFQPPNLGSAGTALADSVMQHTENSMGATKSALGMERPYNTSALVTQQRASSMPLDYQRFDFHDSIESLVRIAVDIFAVDYGTRYVQLESGEYDGWFDYADLKSFEPNMNVDVGAGSYWSEALMLQVLDSMLQYGLIQDPAIYLKALPEGYFKNRSEVLAQMEQQQMAAQEQMMQEQAMAQQAGIPPEQAMAQAQPQGVQLTQDQVQTMDILARLMQLPSLEEAVSVVTDMGLAKDVTEGIIAFLQENWGSQNG